ncbi:MAG: acetate/propionate family kinase [Fibrobacteres bacterium]|nr:acetate/propionate family kinase [Fibrobacterota bacterium]
MKSKMAKKSVNVLVLNCGSSSLKYKLIRMPDEVELVSGEAERVGIKTSAKPFIRHNCRGNESKVVMDMQTHADAFKAVLGLLKMDADSDADLDIHAFGHRYVHPWHFFDRTTRVDERAFMKLEKTLSLAPIHNPVAFSLIEICRNERSDIPQYVVFDTAFHSKLPEEARIYALPKQLVQRHGLRRYGFHGISYQYVVSEACRFLGRKLKDQKIIGCHLGSGGSSVCSVKEGHSIMTSLGFSPLEGLVMNTRCGDIDIGLVFYLMYQQNLNADEIEVLLNKKSGVLGIYGLSSDIRDVIKSYTTDPRAELALSMYTRRVKKYVGYAALLLEKADILIFTDTLGVGVPLVRRRICDNLSWLGIELDTKLNDNYEKGIADISIKGSSTRILIVPTDEEILIARETYGEHIK